MDGAEFADVISQLEAQHHEDLKKRDAFDMVAGRNYVGYLHHEPDGRVSAEVFSWGVCHGKIYGNSAEQVRSKLHTTYDLCSDEQLQAPD